LDPNRTTKTILLVDDDQPLRDVFVGWLTEDGYHMLPAADGEEALAIAERHSSIDLLITDVRLTPQLRGPELAARLQSSRRDLKVIFTSGDPASAHDLPEGSHFLQKPFSLADLSKKVQEVLGR
jgi:CheY-like chemotaxis protein